MDTNIFYSIFIYPIIYIFPAYAANALPIIFGGGKPLDLKKRLGGKRILGDHKTIRGTAAGLVGGLLVGLIEYPFLPYMLPIAILMGIGAVFGDLFGSFIKRRLNFASGKVFPVLDQYGFFVFAILFSFWLGNMPLLYGMIFITVLTGVLHIATNRIAYMIKLKEVPW
jgi:CDP-2,3-bis-(O-geranylgeranyl)-sn-glycerol synthase